MGFSPLYKKIVVKVGSNVLTCADGMLNITRMAHIVEQIAQLKKEGVQVILVTSGAVAAGRAEVELLKLFGQKGSLSEAEVDAIAKAYNLMGNAVMDSLSEKALDRLGHLPIYLNGEEWLVEEDDLPVLQKYLGLEVN